MKEKTNERIAMEAEAEMLIAKLSDAQIAELFRKLELHHASQSISVP